MVGQTANALHCAKVLPHPRLELTAGRHLAANHSFIIPYHPSNVSHCCDHLALHNLGQHRIDASDFEGVDCEATTE